LQAKQKDLKKQGKGWGPKTANPIEDEEVNILYETNQLGHSTPDTIINSLWCNLTTHLGMRVNTEHLNLRWGDITLKSDMFGHEYLELAEEQQTKTRTGADVNDVRKIMISVAKHMIILVIIRSLHTLAQGLTNCSKAF
jgi:hypothetical protein